MRAGDKDAAAWRAMRVVIMLAMVLPATGALAASVDQRVSDLERRFDRMERLMGSDVLREMLQRLNALERDLQEMRDQNDRLRHDLDKVISRQRELYLDLDKRLNALEGGGGTGAAQAAETAPPVASPVAAPVAAGAAAPTSPAPAVQTPAAAAPAAAEPHQPTQQEIAAYRSARDMLLNERRYRQAVQAFRRFLADYPGSFYAANAQYWLAEANYGAKDYPAALEEFRKVFTDYPDSDKVPDARLKLGYTYYELGDWENAKAELSEVKNRYPSSGAARLADQRLRDIKRKGH